MVVDGVSYRATKGRVEQDKSKLDYIGQDNNVSVGWSGDTLLSWSKPILRYILIAYIDWNISKHHFTIRETFHEEFLNDTAFIKSQPEN